MEHGTTCIVVGALSGLSGAIALSLAIENIDYLTQSMIMMSLTLLGLLIGEIASKD